MKTIKTKNRCREIRGRLYELVSSRLGFDAVWVQRHIANCPRCRERLVSVGRVELALSVIKAQPCELDLLMRANTKAIGVLKHGLWEGPKAEKLKSARPEQRVLERLAKYRHSTASAAACIAILFLMKAGVFSSAQRFDSKGKKVLKEYYVKQAGQELADEIFRV